MHTAGAPDERRRRFVAVSDAAIALADRVPASAAVAPRLFVVHCPMYPGSWLQTQEAISNPFDLSMAMGRPGRFDDPELRRLVAGAEAKIRAAGLPMGGVALTPEAAHAKRAAGYRLLLVGFDVLMVEQAARAAVQAVAN